MKQTLEAEDMALNTLLSVAREVVPELPAELIRKIFVLQKTHQFEADRDVSLQDLQRLLDDYVDEVARGGPA